MTSELRNIMEINQLLSLWGHILDAKEWDRLDHVLTPDATYDGSAFKFDRATGIDAIRTVLSAANHALAHHSTNVVVEEAEGDELRVISKGLGVMPGGVVGSVTYKDKLRLTDAGWRISERVLLLVA
ncbi:TPA: nuclear transport factor 2 family protein [Burkholderia cenocepacia]|nr:nuclear transport factor 2 family protein [Burkholderia cenocepacia]